MIRHSGADHCHLTASANLVEAWVEILDDGVGSACPPDGGGSGLLGLKQRVDSLHGRFEAGPRRPVGFRLAVAIPGPPPSAVADPPGLIAAQPALVSPQPAQ